MHKKGSALIAVVIIGFVFVGGAGLSIWKWNEQQNLIEDQIKEQFIAEENSKYSTVVDEQLPALKTTSTPLAPATKSATINSESQKIITPATSASKVAAQNISVGGTKYSDGIMPLGDNKYVTSGAKKGYIYLCNVRSGGGGAQANGPWITGTAWNYLQKISIAGNVSWPNATFSETIAGVERVFSGNDLPKNHATGVFPVSQSDLAYQYDRNPNSIRAQSFELRLPLSPTLATTPSCMGGEVGIMKSGVPLFNGFDAENRDAVAHEVQDHCSGHPQVTGQYHYHSMSACFSDTSIKTVLGFALDGFPITGPFITAEKYLTTEDLDECHGIKSEIVLDGKTISMYHYVLTRDFPYSVSCFKGKPKQMMVISGGNGGGQSAMPPGGGQVTTPTGGVAGGAGQMPGQPPQEAITACQGKTTGAQCNFVSPHNDTISGICASPGGALACVPQ